MNQRHLLPPADQQLLARLAAHPDPAEAVRRRRLIGDEPGECEANQARDAALSKLLTLLLPPLRDITRFDRIIRACCWGTLSDNEAHQPVQSTPLAAVAPAAQQSTTRARVPAPTHPAPTLRAPCTGAPVEDESTSTANIVQADLKASAEQPCTAAAVRFLERTLASGERDHRDVQADAGRLRLTPAMLRAARKQLQIVSERRGFGPLCRSYWRLPLVRTEVQSGVTRTQPEVTPSAAQGAHDVRPPADAGAPHQNRIGAPQ